MIRDTTCGFRGTLWRLMGAMTPSLGTFLEFEAHCLSNLPGDVLSKILASRTLTPGLLTQTSVCRHEIPG